MSSISPPRTRRILASPCCVIQSMTYRDQHQQVSACVTRAAFFETGASIDDKIQVRAIEEHWTFPDDAPTLQRYRRSSATNARGSGPIYSAAGRINLLSARCSITCAHQPLVRAAHKQRREERRRDPCEMISRCRKEIGIRKQPLLVPHQFLDRHRNVIQISVRLPDRQCCASAWSPRSADRVSL